jgi:hypothetical protein
MHIVRLHYTALFACTFSFTHAFCEMLNASRETSHCNGCVHDHRMWSQFAVMCIVAQERLMILIVSSITSVKTLRVM